MSMLSAQVDKLREIATRYDELQVGAVKAVTMPSNMGSILREAADTIWELRDDLQRANAENAKLRKKADMLQWNSDCFIKIYGSWKRLRASVPHLERENAKLRRVIESEIHCMSGVCKDCVAYRPAEDGWCDQQVWLEELGIEGHL